MCSSDLGDWKAGRFDGRGELRHRDGATYSGSFKAGGMERGIVTWADGRGLGKYEGEFNKSNGLEGEGTYTALNGRQFTGQWSNYGKLNGTQFVEDLEEEAKRLGPPPSPTTGSSCFGVKDPFESLSNLQEIEPLSITQPLSRKKKAELVIQQSELEEAVVKCLEDIEQQETRKETEYVQRGVQNEGRHLQEM